MFTTFFSLSLLLALVQSVLAQYGGFMIDTPSLVQCQSAQITWASTGNPPYDLLIVPANDPCGNAIEDLGNQTSTSINWNVNITAGTQVVLSLIDAVGNEAWSGTITVGDSSNTSCLTSTSPSPTSSVSGNPYPGGPSTTTSTTSTTSSLPTSSAFAPAGAAGAGVVHSTGVLSTRPLSAVTLLGSAVLAVVAFIL